MRCRWRLTRSRRVVAASSSAVTSSRTHARIAWPPRLAKLSMVEQLSTPACGHSMRPVSSALRSCKPCIELVSSEGGNIMKAALFYGGSDIRVAELPTPEPGPGEVLVRVRSAGICGSDLHTYRGANPWRMSADTFSRGRQDGHELAGEVAAIGPGVSELA